MFLNCHMFEFGIQFLADGVLGVGANWSVQGSGKGSLGESSTFAQL